MLKLGLDIKRESIEIPKKLKNSFHDPLVFYLYRNAFLYLNMFVVLDFNKETITYIETYSEENEKLVRKEYGISEKMRFSAHSSISMSDSEFITSLYPTTHHIYNNTFRVIDSENSQMKIYTLEDLGFQKSGKICDTITKYKDDSFYMSFYNLEKKALDYYRISLDLKNVEYIFTDKNEMHSGPHQILRHKNFILSTGFAEKRGAVLVYNMHDKSIKSIAANSRPAHLEHVGDDNIYYSSNNVKAIKYKVLCLGRARIGKLRVCENEVVLKKKFVHDTGFRFASHKMLSQSTITTIGFPNRLFFINTNDMSLDYYYDIDKKILPDGDCLSFLNEVYENKYFNPDRYTAIETSDDGTYVVFFNQENIRFFNYYKREIEFEIPYKKKEGYYQYSIHCDFLR